MTIVSKLRNYKSVMYRDLTDHRLRTGDVIKLDSSDFEKILKNYKILSPLLSNYENNPKYKSNYWAILNKPCDMVHEGTQKFKSSSLFLAPLQGFKGELKKDRIFSDYVKHPQSINTFEQKVPELYQRHLINESKRLFPINEGMEKTEKIEIGAKRKAFINDEQEILRDAILPVIENYETPDEVEAQLKIFAESAAAAALPSFITFGKALADEPAWVAYKTEYETYTQSNNQIHLNQEEIGELVQQVFLNQMEIRGRFYYEPHAELYSAQINDFSFIIELEDLITLKVNDQSVEDGSLVGLLKQNRVVGLERNFSDRLQNIMGYYYSKIGTPDVKGEALLALYDDCFDDFFLS